MKRLLSCLVARGGPPELAPTAVVVAGAAPVVPVGHITPEHAQLDELDPVVVVTVLLAPLFAQRRERRDDELPCFNIFLLENNSDISQNKNDEIMNPILLDFPGEALSTGDVVEQSSDIFYCTIFRDSKVE